METFNNKYKTWHDNIIANGKKRILIGYKEKHHILPRCLGGKDNQENLVELTAKEHFIVHMLLCKFTKGNINKKMVFAFIAMSFIKGKNRNYKATSRIAEKLKLQFIKIQTGRKFSKETLAKLSKIRKGRKLTAEHKRKIGLTSIGRKQSKESILKRTSKTTGMKRTQEFKDRMSEIAKNRTFSEETKRKIGLAQLGNKKALGMKHINKDGKSKMVNANEVDKYLNQGYKLGMDRSYITLAYRKHKSEIAQLTYRRY